MEISDQEYIDLKKEKIISEAIAMINSEMVDDKEGRIKKEQDRYIGYAEYLSKSINTLECLRNDSTVMALLKIDKYLQFYLNELRKSNYSEPEAVSVLEKLKNDSYLTSLLDFNIDKYIQYQIDKLKKSKESFLESKPKRIGKFDDRDVWLGDIILKLKSLGIKKQPIIVDFIYRLYKEFDLLELEYDNVDKDLKDDDDDLEYKREYLYDIKKSEIKSNIRKIVKTALSN